MLYDGGAGKKARCTFQPLQSNYELQAGLKQFHLFTWASSAETGARSKAPHAGIRTNTC